MPVGSSLLVLILSLTCIGCSSSHVSQTADARTGNATIVLFSPTSVTGESIRDETIRHINQTRQTLDIAMYGFTEPSLAEALIDAKARGVMIRLILDNSQAKGTFSQMERLVASVPVKMMTGIKGTGIMHHKMAIYDGHMVQTGSFNWTKNASCCSWENAVFISDGTVVQRFQQAFDAMWSRETDRAQ